MPTCRRLAIVAALLCLSTLVQAVVIRQAVVPGLDAVRFVEIAQTIEQQGMASVLGAEREQPLFPLWLWLVHQGVTRLAGQFPAAWALSTQLAAAIPLVLTVVPVYFIALRLVGPAAGLAGSLLFCVMPEVARLGADGISDSTHLLFFALAFWAVVAYWSRARGQGSGDSETRRVSPAAKSPTAYCLLPAGIATGIAALARVEVLVLPLALAISFVVFQFRSGWRRSWPDLAAGVGCFALGFALVTGPYLAVGGSIAPSAVDESLPDTVAASADGLVCQLAEGRPMSFAVKEPGRSIRRRGYPAAVVQFGEELADAFNYWVGALALFGLWRLRRRGSRPADRFVQIFFVTFSLAVIRFTTAEGYLSARHLMPLIVAGIGCVGYGAVELGSSFGVLLARLRPIIGPRLATARFSSACVVVAIAGLGCLPQTLCPLHANHLGHRRAGEWLVTQADAPGAVLDTRGWSGLYSARKTYRYEESRTAFADPRLAYVVLQREELQTSSDRSHTLRSLLRLAAEPAATFSASAFSAAAGRQSRGKTVVVYRWYPKRFLFQQDRISRPREAKSGRIPKCASTSRRWSTAQPRSLS